LDLTCQDPKIAQSQSFFLKMTICCSWRDVWVPVAKYQSAMYISQSHHKF